jgi:hypothetical protein
MKKLEQAGKESWQALSEALAESLPLTARTKPRGMPSSAPTPP